MATKVWRVKRPDDHRSSTYQQPDQKHARIKYTTTASDDIRCSRKKHKHEKEVGIKNAVAVFDGSGSSKRHEKEAGIKNYAVAASDRSSNRSKHEKEAGIKNAVAASGYRGSSNRQKHEKEDGIMNVNAVAASGYRGSSNRQNYEKEAGIKNYAVAASGYRGSSKRQKHEKEAGINYAVAASGYSGSSKREKHEKEDGIKNVNAVAASGYHGSSKRQKHEKEAGVKSAIVSSGYLESSNIHEKEAGFKNYAVAAASRDMTGGSSKQKHEKETRIDVGISLDHRNLGPKKKLLVIPLRGICVQRAHRWFPETIPRNRRPDFRYGNFLVYVRPYCVDFLRFCFKRFHVGLWSSAREQNLQGILSKVIGDLKNKLLFTWDQKHCTDSGFTCLEKQDKPLFLKELSLLWDKKYPNLPWSDGEFSASNTLLITNPAKALLNPPNTAIFLPGYDPENRRDDLLGPKGELRVFLNGLAEAEDVQSYVESHPIGDPEITPSHPDWDYYCKIICSFNKKRNGDDVKLI